MIETLGTLLLGMVLGAVAAAGLLIWFDRRSMEDDIKEAAEQQKRRC